MNINIVDHLSSMPGTWLTAELINALHNLGIVDINAFLNNTANKLINELGLD